MRCESVYGGEVGMTDRHDTSGARPLLDAALLAGLTAADGEVSVDFASGDPAYPRVAIVAAERIGDDARTAAIAALIALGYTVSDLAFVEIDAAAGEGTLRATLDTLDPESIVTVDARAAGAVEAAFPASPGENDVPRVVGGRRIVGLGDLAGSLGSTATKREVWGRFKLVSPRGPVY